MEKFYSKSDEEILLGYSKMSKPNSVFNSTMSIVEEAIYVRFNYFKLDKKLLEPIQFVDFHEPKKDAS